MIHMFHGERVEGFSACPPVRLEWDEPIGDGHHQFSGGELYSHCQEFRIIYN